MPLETMEKMTSHQTQALFMSMYSCNLAPIYAIFFETGLGLTM
jgi:hypothetical protein